MTHGGQHSGRVVAWLALVLTATYIAIHLPMLYRSLVEWGHLVSSLFGQ